MNLRRYSYSYSYSVAISARNLKKPDIQYDDDRNVVSTCSKLFVDLHSARMRKNCTIFTGEEQSAQ